MHKLIITLLCFLVVSIHTFAQTDWKGSPLERKNKYDAIRLVMNAVKMPLSKKSENIFDDEYLYYKGESADIDAIPAIMGTKKTLYLNGKIWDRALLSNGIIKFNKYVFPYILIFDAAGFSIIKMNDDGYYNILLRRILFNSSGERLVIENNGNLIVYNNLNQPVWSTGTAGKGGYRTHLFIHTNGNVVLYRGIGNKPDSENTLWSSETCEGCTYNK